MDPCCAEPLNRGDHTDTAKQNRFFDKLFAEDMMDMIIHTIHLP